MVAGPPGSGKSTSFPVSGFGVKFFNAEEFVNDCIHRHESFSIETTLRSHITFEQARIAKEAGFTIEMRYLAPANFELHLERVKARADAGGHSASEETLRGIHNASLRNLPRAIEETDEIWIYDNTKFGGPPLLVMEAKAGEIVGISNPCPAWLEGVMR